MRRPAARQGSGCVASRTGDPASSGIEAPAWIVGAIVPALNDPRILIRPAPPAAVMRWPRLDLGEPVGTSLHPAKASARLRISVASPTGVPVAWHSTKPTSEGAI